MLENKIDKLLSEAVAADPPESVPGLQGAVLAAAQQHCGSTAYYMYLRMQRKLDEAGYGHVKRAVISGVLLHHGWHKQRRTNGIYWFPPTATAPFPG